MKLIITMALILSFTLMTACKSSDSSSSSEMETDMQTSSSKKFDQLVSNMFAQTNDTDKPVKTNALSIEFNHDEANFEHLF